MSRTGSFSSQGQSSVLTSEHGGSTAITSTDQEYLTSGGGGAGGINIKKGSKLDRVFGVITAIPCASFEHTRRWATFYQLCEYLQLYLYLILPLWKWNIDPENKFFLWLYRVHFQYAAAHQGIGSAVALMYVAGVLVCINAVFLVHVGWQVRQNKSINKWILRVGRFTLTFVSQLFFMNVVNIFLLPSACDWWGVKTGIKNTMFYAPSQKCFKGVYAGHALVGAIFLVIHVAVGLISSLRYSEYNVAGGTPNHTYGSVITIQHYVARVLLAILTFEMTGYRPELSSFLIITVCLWMLVLHLYTFYYGSKIENVLFTGLYTAMTFTAVILFIKESISTVLDKKLATIVLAAGIAPAALIGIGLYFLRARFLSKTIEKLSDIYAENPTMTEDAALDRYLFPYPYSAINLVRHVLLHRHKPYQETEIELADWTLRVAQVQFPQHSLLFLALSSYRSLVKQDIQGGHNQAEIGVKMTKSFFERLEFHLITKKTSKKVGSSADDALDLSNYMEFASTWKSLLRLHKRVLSTNRTFWMQCLHTEVKEASLIRTVRRLKELSERCDQNYRQVIERYPRSVAVLRTYARFLEEVKLDPVTAGHYLSEADKMEDRLVEQHRDMAQGEGSAAFSAGLTDLDESPEPVVMVNFSGQIVYTNRATGTMFGYRKQDLEGKSLSMLMPAPFSQKHSSYMKNYLTTGTAKILDSTREVVALHKDRFVFPVNLHVRRITNAGVDYFMGVFSPIEQDSNSSVLWMAPTGSVLFVSQSFQDLTGYKTSDVAGKSVSTILATPEDEANLMAYVESILSKQKADESLDVSVRHMVSNDVVKARASVRIAGSEESVLVTVTFQLEDASKMGIFSVSAAGRITYANTQFGTFLGYSVKDLLKMDISQLITEPWAVMHQAWIKGNNKSNVDGRNLRSCTAGRYAAFKARSGRAVPFFLRVSEIKDSAGRTIKDAGAAYSCTATLQSDGVASSLANRLQVVVSPADLIIQRVEGSKDAFGVEPESLAGMTLDALIDMPTGEKGVATLELMAERASGAESVIFYRPGIKLESGAIIPGTVSVTRNSSGSFDVTVIRADCTESIIECSREGAGAIKDMNADAAAVFGYSRESMLKKTACELMPQVRRVQDLLLDEGSKKGGLRMKHCGPNREIEACHADGEANRVAVIASHSKEDPEKMFLLVTVPAPAIVNLPVPAAEEEEEEAEREEGGKGSLSSGSLLAKPRGRGRKPGHGVRDSESPMGEHGRRQGKGKKGVVKAASGSISESDKGGDSSDEETVVPKRQNRNTLKWIEDNFDPVGKPMAEAGVGEEKEKGGDGDKGSAEGHHAGTEAAVPATRAATLAAGDSNPAIKANEASQEKPAAISITTSVVSQSATDIPLDNEESIHVATLDSEKAKRFIRIKRMLASPRAAFVMFRVKNFSLLLLLVILVAHIIDFSVVKTTTSKFEVYIKFTSDAAQQAAQAYRLLAEVTKIEAANRNFRYSPAQVAAFQAELARQTTKVEDFNYELYLGRGTGLNADTQKLKSLYEYPELPMYSRDNGLVTMKKAPLFDAINQVVSVARKIGNNQTTLVDSDPNIYFLKKNIPDTIAGAMLLSADYQLQRSEAILYSSTSVFIAFLVVECLLIIPVCIIILWFFYLTALKERSRLYSVFLMAPSVAICEVAQRSTKIGVDEDEDDNEDDEDVMAKRAIQSAAAAEDRKLKRHQAQAEGRQLSSEEAKAHRLELASRAMKKLRVRNTKTLFPLLWPLFCWFAVALACVAASWKYLDMNVTSLYVLRMQATEDVGLAEVIYRTTELYVAEDLKTQTECRKSLGKAKDFLANTHIANLYGSDEYKVPKDMLAKGWYYNIYYTPGCMRTRNPPCVKDTSGFYYIVHTGLHTALEYLVESAGSVAVDFDGSIAMSSNRFQFILDEAPEDLSDGTATATKICIAKGSHFSSITGIQTACLVVLVVGLVFYYLYAIRPFVSLLNGERESIAKLLSELPKTVDVDTYVADVFAQKRKVSTKIRFYQMCARVMGRIFGGDVRDSEPRGLFRTESEVETEIKPSTSKKN